MKIFIDDVRDDEGEVKAKLYIESDSYGYQVKRYNGTRFDEKSQKEVDITTTLANYSTVSGCCKFIINMMIKDSEATNLSELLQDIKRIEEFIESKIAV